MRKAAGGQQSAAAAARAAKRRREEQQAQQAASAAKRARAGAPAAQVPRPPPAAPERPSTAVQAPKAARAAAQGPPPGFFDEPPQGALPPTSFRRLGISLVPVLGLWRRCVGDIQSCDRSATPRDRDTNPGMCTTGCQGGKQPGCPLQRGPGAPVCERLPLPYAARRRRCSCVGLERVVDAERGMLCAFPDFF